MPQLTRFKLGRREFAIPKSLSTDPRINRLFRAERVFIIDHFNKIPTVGVPGTKIKVATEVRKHIRRMRRIVPVIKHERKILKRVRIAQTPKIHIDIPEIKLPKKLLSIKDIEWFEGMSQTFKEIALQPARFKPLPEHLQYQKHQAHKREEHRTWLSQFSQPTVTLKKDYEIRNEWSKGRERKVKVPIIRYEMIAKKNGTERRFSGKISEIDEVNDLVKPLKTISIHGKPKFVYDSKTKKLLQRSKEVNEEYLKVSEGGKRKPLQQNIEMLNEILKMR